MCNTCHALQKKDARTFSTHTLDDTHPTRHTLLTLSNSSPSLQLHNQHNPQPTTYRHALHVMLAAVKAPEIIMWTTKVSLMADILSSAMLFLAPPTFVLADGTHPQCWVGLQVVGAYEEGVVAQVHTVGGAGGGDKLMKSHNSEVAHTHGIADSLRERFHCLLSARLCKCLSVCLSVCVCMFPHLAAHHSASPSPE